MSLAFGMPMLSRRFVLLTVTALSWLLLTSDPASASRRPPPQSVHHYEEVAGFSQSPAPDGSLGISFQAFGRSFDLVLEKNSLFSSHAEDVWVNRKGTTNEHNRSKPQAQVYKGQVGGETDSWVRMSVRGDTLDGVVRSQGELYFVEPAARFFRAPGEPGMVVYRVSDTASELGPGSCALENPAIEQALAASESAIASPSRILPELQTLAATTLKQIDIALVADYEYYAEHGAASAADMQALINQVDGILQSELGLTLRVSTTVVHTSVQDPFSGTIDSEALLNEFTNYKGSSSSPIYGSDLAQLFTNRDLDGSLIGIAWVGSLCTGAWGSSLVQDFSTTAKSMVILSAHEIGHNLAAHHDAQLGSLCELIPFGFIMYPSISTDLNLQFSTCSKSSINAHVATASCLAEVGSGTPIPTPTPTPAPTCSFSISPASVSLGSSAGNGSVNVTTAGGCNWTASSSASWLTVSSGASGSGSGTVVYAASANPGPTSRSATLTVAGRTFTVSQSAPPTASIRVIAPNGGEAWPIGATRTITWTSSGVSGYVKLELSRDGGTTWSVLASSTPNDGSQGWVVTAPATTRARFRVTSVNNSTIRDSSDGDVRVGGGTLTVTAPNGGESWTAGTTQRIRWTSTNLSGNVRIEVSRDGIYWTTITSNTANDGDHPWFVTTPRSTNSWVRVRSVTETTVTDKSNAKFTIR